MISAIVFDYGGVIKINEIRLFDAIIKCLDIGIEEWENEYYKLNHLTNVKGMTPEELALLIAAKFTKSENKMQQIRDIFHHRKDKYRLNHELIELMKELKDKKFKIGLLSNYTTELRQKLSDDGIIDLFDAAIISSEVGHQKPNKEIFEILFSELGVKANEVVFIDDTKKSLEEAENIGYTPVLYIDNEQLKSDLTRILGTRFGTHEK